MTNLIAPYGGSLIDLFDSAVDITALPSIQISERSRCDLELLATGGFSPLDRFMSRADYDRVLDEMRLAGGLLFPIPITLPIGDDAPVAFDRDVLLRGPRNQPLAVMTVEEIYERRGDEAERVFGTRDTRHPLVAEMAYWGRRAVSGRLRVIGVATPHDFRDLRRTPRDVRALLASLGRENVVAFQTRNPMHRAREALWHAIIRRNFGANPFIVGRDHASPGAGFYGPYDAQELVARHEHEIGVTTIPFRELVYVVSEDRYEEASRIAPHLETRSLSGTEVRENYLGAGRPLPQWFTRREVAEILTESHPPRHRQGFCVWFTGLSGAGKSTTSAAGK